MIASRLLALAWLFFTVSVFWGLFIAPRLTLGAAVDPARVAGVVERWWQSERVAAEPTIVMLAPADCRCAIATSTWPEAIAGFALHRPREGSVLPAVLRSALPTAAQIDTLVFDADGRLRLALDRYDSAHCIEIVALLRRGADVLAALPEPIVWPGLCPCP